MNGAVALGGEVAGEAPVIRSRDEFRDVLERVLHEVDDDERILTLLRAASLRLRFSYPDLRLVLNVAAGSEPDQRLHWRFSDRVEWSPKLEMEMDSEVANRYLRGRESLAIAIARGRVRCRGGSRTALLYVPAIRLVCEPYRQVITSEFPHLAIA